MSPKPSNKNTGAGSVEKTYYFTSNPAKVKLFLSISHVLQAVEDVQHAEGSQAQSYGGHDFVAALLQVGGVVSTCNPNCM
jgi:hypothetical protein